MTLLAAEVDFELREVVLRDKPKELIAASPKGTVPVLILPNSTVIEESLDIMKWALSQNDPERWMQAGKESPAETWKLISINDEKFKFHLDRYKYPNRFESVDPLKHRESALEFLNILKGRLKTHPFLFGSQVSIADIAIFPFVRQFAAVDKTWFEESVGEQVRHWLTMHLESQLFARAMEKHPPWNGSNLP